MKQINKNIITNCDQFYKVNSTGSVNSNKNSKTGEGLSVDIVCRPIIFKV